MGYANVCCSTLSPNNEFVQKYSATEEEVIDLILNGPGGKDEVDNQGTIYKTTIRIRNNLDMRILMHFGMTLRTLPWKDKFCHIVHKVQKSKHSLAHQLKLRKNDEILWIDYHGTLENVTHSEMVDMLQEILPMQTTFKMIIRRFKTSIIIPFKQEKCEYCQITANLDWEGRLLEATYEMKTETNLLVKPPKQIITDLKATTRNRLVVIRSDQDMESFLSIEKKTNEITCSVNPDVFSVQVYSGNNNTSLQSERGIVFFTIIQDRNESKVISGDQNSVSAIQMSSENVYINTDTTDTLDKKPWHFLLLWKEDITYEFESLDRPGYFLARRSDNTLGLSRKEDCPTEAATQFSFHNPHSQTYTGIPPESILGHRPEGKDWSEIISPTPDERPEHTGDNESNSDNGSDIDSNSDSDSDSTVSSEYQRQLGKQLIQSLLFCLGRCTCSE